MFKSTRTLLLALSFSVFGFGCATAGSPAAYTDTDMELAQQHAEDATLARLAMSNNNDIADAASSLARERATR